MAKIDITNEDNMQLMARYPDKYFDLAIVDPPYGIERFKKVTDNPSDKDVHGEPFFHEREFSKRIVPARHAVYSHKVHREEHEISPYECEPEMEIAQFLVHHAAEHFRIPMVDTTKHTEYRSRSHYQVEVSHYEIGVVQVDVKRSVTYV